MPATLVPAQLERLQQDYTDLEHYIQRLQKDETSVADKGKIPALKKRQELIEQMIHKIKGL